MGGATEAILRATNGIQGFQTIFESIEKAEWSQRERASEVFLGLNHNRSISIGTFESEWDNIRIWWRSGELSAGHTCRTWTTENPREHVVREKVACWPNSTQRLSEASVNSRNRPFHIYWVVLFFSVYINENMHTKIVIELAKGLALHLCQPFASFVVVVVVLSTPFHLSSVVDCWDPF